MHFKKVFAVFAITVLLSGCAGGVRGTWDLLASSQVSPTLVIVAGNSFDALEVTATNYLRLPRCNSFNGPVCRSPQVTVKLIPAVRAGRVARNNLERFLREHPGQLADQGLYDALTATTQTLQDIIVQYNIGARR